MLKLQEARAVMYGGHIGESWQRQVANAAEERKARADGFSAVELAEPPANAYPKTMEHPGFPNGGATGMLVKDYRGKNAEQEIWKFDAGLVGKICEALKQAAIEEGQWTEKRLCARIRRNGQLAETWAFCPSWDLLVSGFRP